MKMPRVGVICGIQMLLAASVWGANGNITGITVKSANLGLNQPIEVTVQGTVAPGKTCDITFVKGDGTPKSLAGNASSFPFKFGGQPYALWVYDKPGTYHIKVYSDKCTGEGKATVKVTGKITAVEAGVLAKDPCPQGWHKKSGSTSSIYTCVPNKPAQKPQCPPGTMYFETECSLGCEAVIN